MTDTSERKDESQVHGDAVVNRRRLLTFGTLITGVSAFTSLGMNSAKAAPPPQYVPIAEKGMPKGVATLDADAKIPSVQLPNFSAVYSRRRKYDVRDYMGTDDIGAAINRAIAAAAADGNGFGSVGGQVVVPHGNFAQTTTIMPKSGVDLIGQGWGRTVLRPQGAVTSIRRNTELDSASPTNFLRDVTFEGFEIDGSQQSGGSDHNLLKGMFIAYIYRGTFRGIYVHDTGHTAIGNDSQNETVYEDCVAEGAGRIGGITGPGCSGLGFGTSGVWWGASFPTAHEYALKVINCIGRNNARYGMFFETQIPGNRQKDIQVVNFSASGNGSAGLGDSGCDGLSVIGGELKNNTGAGFAVDAGTYAAGTTGINGRVSGTIIRNNGADGILVDSRTTPGGSGYVFNNVVSRDNAGNGYSLQVGTVAISRMKIANSEFIANGAHGVYVKSIPGGTGGPISDLSMVNNDLFNNGKAAAGHGFRQDTETILYRPKFIGNTATDTAGTRTQGFGLSFGASVVGGVISDNILTSNATNAAADRATATYNLGLQGAGNFDAQTVIGRNLGYNVAAGSPEGVISAPAGTSFTRLGAPAGKTEYIKTMGASTSTGWVPSGSVETSGSTADRPIAVEAGTRYLDTTLAKPIWWSGVAWKDATGTTV